MREQWNKFWYKIEGVDPWDVRFGKSNPNTYYFRWNGLWLMILTVLFIILFFLYVFK